MSDLQTQLANSVDIAKWSWLLPHVKRDAVILVHEQLDLAEVGTAVAEDNVPYVQHWIGKELIRKPSEDELSAWSEKPSKEFDALIVSPFVLVQER